MAKTATRSKKEVVSEEALAAMESAGNVAPVVEALLFAVERPVNGETVAQHVGLLPKSDPTNESEGPAAHPSLVQAAKDRVQKAVEELNAAYEQTGRSFRIESVAGGYRVMTLPQFAEVIAGFHKARLNAKLTRAAIETLAIIAYKQPITRAELEAIRGVACGEVLKTLTDRRLVTVKGRAEVVGRPMLYGTTPQFLDQFGMASIKDLPTLAELKPV
jgi:segregation and condensation protein B